MRSLPGKDVSCGGRGGSWECGALCRAPSTCVHTQGHDYDAALPGEARTRRRRRTRPQTPPLPSSPWTRVRNPQAPFYLPFRKLLERSQSPSRGARGGPVLEISPAF